MGEDIITKAAILLLEGLLVSPKRDIEAIAAMPIEEVEEGLRQMGLNPDQPLPEKIRQLISGSDRRQRSLAVNTNWPYRLLKQSATEEHHAPPTGHEGQTAARPPGFALVERGEQSRNVRYREDPLGRFDEADALYKQGVGAYKDNSIDQAIEHWRKAKIIFLSIDMKREIAACDRNIGVAFEKLGQSEQAREQFERAKRVFLGIGLKELADSCNSHLTAYRELSGHRW